MNRFQSLTRFFPRLAAISFLVLTFSAPGHADVSAKAGDQEARARAADAIEQAAKADPTNPELWLHLGFAREKMGQTDAAAQAFEKASSIDPKSTDALFMLGLIYEKKNQKSDALRVWKQYLASGPSADKKAMAEKHIHQLSQ